MIDHSFGFDGIAFFGIILFRYFLVAGGTYLPNGLLGLPITLFIISNTLAIPGCISPSGITSSAHMIPIMRRKWTIAKSVSNI
jgi:hypothetical protein